MKNFPSKTKPYLFFFLSWAFPGLGHFLQKKRVKGAVFLSGIFSLLVLGLLLEGDIGSLYDFQLLTIVKFLGSLGSGVFYFIMKLAGFDTGNVKAITFDFGSTYIVTAGFMNYLIAFNAYEIACGTNNA